MADTFRLDEFAFPQPTIEVDGRVSHAGDYGYAGMTLRDYFAALAMHAELNTAGAFEGPAQSLAEAADLAGQSVEERIANNAYRLADGHAAGAAPLMEIIGFGKIRNGAPVMDHLSWFLAQIPPAWEGKRIRYTARLEGDEQDGGYRGYYRAVILPAFAAYMRSEGEGAATPEMAHEVLGHLFLGLGPCPVTGMPRRRSTSNGAGRGLPRLRGRAGVAVSGAGMRVGSAAAGSDQTQRTTRAAAAATRRDRIERSGTARVGQYGFACVGVARTRPGGLVGLPVGVSEAFSRAGHPGYSNPPQIEGCTLGTHRAIEGSGATWSWGQRPGPRAAESLIAGAPCGCAPGQFVRT